MQQSHFYETSRVRDPPVRDEASSSGFFLELEPAARVYNRSGELGVVHLQRTCAKKEDKSLGLR